MMVNYSKKRRKSIFYKQRQLYKYFHQAGYTEKGVRNSHWAIFFISLALVFVASLLLILFYLKGYDAKFGFAVIFLTLTFTI